MTNPPSRRPLDFRDLDEVVRDVETLRAGGYGQAGRWNLAQACDHLADWMEFPLDGFPTPWPLRPALWLMRNTVGPRQRDKVLASRTMPSGLPTLRQTVHPPQADEGRSVDRLLRTIARFRDHRGPLQPSPIMGELSRDQWTQLQLIHAAHHLGFLIPKA